MISGCPASALAHATRCCWPPDSSDGRWRRRSRRPRESMTESSHSRIRLAAGDVHRKGDVLRRGQRRDQVVGLEDESDPVATQRRHLLVGQTDQFGVADHHRPRSGAVEPSQTVHQRRLARSRRPHDRGELAGGEIDTDIVERPHRCVTGAVGLAQMSGPGGRNPRRVHQSLPLISARTQFANWCALTIHPGEGQNTRDNPEPPLIPRPGDPSRAGNHVPGGQRVDEPSGTTNPVS